MTKQKKRLWTHRADLTAVIPTSPPSLNAEEAGDEANNVATLSLQADARADISLDDPA